MITFLIYFLFIFIVQKIAKLPEPEGKKDSLIYNFYLSLFIPSFIPFIYSAILTFIQFNIFSFHNTFNKTSPSSILLEIWTFGLIELFIICILGQFAGSWRHSTKKGGRNNRYRDNPYIYYFNEAERKIARKMLLIPLLALILVLLSIIFKAYIEKK